MRKPKPTPPAAPPSDDPMQSYAMRVWDGQSISLPIAERVRRVEAALAEQGCTDMSAINLPASAE